MSSKPPRVQNIEQYYSQQPPTPSPRCDYWVQQLQAGWRPNRRLSHMGYYDAADFYGVWIWEYCHVLLPLILSQRSGESATA